MPHFSLFSVYEYYFIIIGESEKSREKCEEGGASELFFRCTSYRESNREDPNTQGDSKLLSGFPFIGHGNPKNNLESACIVKSALGSCKFVRLSRLLKRYAGIGLEV
jgi:hypothetical protein